MKERYILEALQSTVVNAIETVNPSMVIKAIGRTVKPATTGIWVELIHIPNNYEGEMWGSDKTYRGLFRVVFHQKMDDTGAYPLLDIVKSVSELLPKGLLCTDSGNNVSVKISDSPNVTGIFEETPELIIPLSLRYICFTT